MASVLTGAMRSLLPKLAALLEKRYKLSRGAKKEIASLREEMSSMNALLLKLARTQLDEQQRDWRDKVRELSYDMEDCMDVFTDELDGGGGGNARAGLLSGLKKLQARYRIAGRIQELKDRAVEASDRHDRYSGKLDETPRGLVAVDPRVQALYAEADGLVGMDGPKKKLVELLGTEEDAQRLKVIAVVGSGGMGKTTLVNQVYSAMKSQFECKTIVSVSQNPSIFKVLCDIYSGICGRMPYALDDECQLIDELREHLEGKRYAHMSNWISCLFTCADKNEQFAVGMPGSGPGPWECSPCGRTGPQIFGGPKFICFFYRAVVMILYHIINSGQLVFGLSCSTMVVVVGSILQRGQFSITFSSCIVLFRLMPMIQIPFFT